MSGARRRHSAQPRTAVSTGHCREARHAPKRKRAAELVKLNVGGVKYETTLTTLTADGDDSMLGSMFSGRHELHPDDDGEVFIDRDGKHFGHILNVLRDSSVAVNINDRAALHAELKYHGISEERCKRLIIVSDHNGNRCRFDVFGKVL